MTERQKDERTEKQISRKKLAVFLDFVQITLTPSNPPPPPTNLDNLYHLCQKIGLVGYASVEISLLGNPLYEFVKLLTPFYIG